MSLLYRKISKELLWAKMFFGDNQSCFEKEKKKCLLPFVFLPSGNSYEQI